MMNVEYHYVSDSKELGGINRLSLDDFENHLVELKKTRHNLRVEELLRLEELPEDTFMITFDDSLRPTYLEVLPILEKHHVQGVFFLNTLPIVEKEKLLPLEKQRVAQYFEKDYSLFFSRFCSLALETYPNLPKEKFQDKKEFRDFAEKTYYPEFTFYTPLERYFRILRRDYLSETQTRVIMDELFSRYFNEKKWANFLNIRKGDVKELIKKGHAIGGHTHTHPNILGELSVKEQESEIKTNLDILEKITGQKIDIFSYPTNSFGHETIEILKKLGITCSFKADNKFESREDFFRIPRIDAALVKEVL